MKFCGLVFFGLLLAGICPTRQVELEALPIKFSLTCIHCNSLSFQ